MIYAALLLVVVIGFILVLAMNSSNNGVPSSGYTYLKFKDGVYIGSEKTDLGNIKAEVTINNERIKDIKLVEFPTKYLNDNTALNDEIPKMIYDVIQTQNIMTPMASDNSAYVLNKILKAIRNALDQSLLE